ncbi:KpsF/GutQ family sugar-phosphate isomerase [Companilactobacillus halodurans]|uniref:SIS domain-containing protein n=1 Tax=Companilactobacillus halodurans TaxID=2584183 RepID=A0A5P1A058_9LACO|nr:SIS domain-containing protein [Companilactobacillus halodurans]MQS76723.1 SIS domain-containing protein [Companilactobacillus halodurans]MQS98432.1 SIS domain-containing protein [Companilactobacillus halodurans]
MDALKIFERVMDDEANAIKDAKRSIESDKDIYLKIVNKISNLSGHLIFMGVGKSGHIGEKLAATFSSTGTPSFFVHATEAMHGDLGMITKSDLVVMISNSGETKEALAPISAIHKIGTEVIGITKKLDSNLAKISDFVLIVPVDGEADKFNLAPTKSSTAVLAVGDSLAITVSELNSFKEKDFAMFHPGGALGKKLFDDGLVEG